MNLNTLQIVINNTWSVTAVSAIRNDPNSVTALWYGDYKICRYEQISMPVTVRFISDITNYNHHESKSQTVLFSWDYRGTNYSSINKVN